MLSDRSIIRRLLCDDDSRIVITPLISAPEQIGPSSVDVRLGTEFLIVERSDRERFDPLMSVEEYNDWLKHVRLTHRYSVLEPFILHPLEFALASTLEFISIPDDVVAHIDGRSSWARQGLKVHSTAGNIHPGSKGFVVFELENVGPVPILLYPGLAIAQLTFDLLDGHVLEDYSKRPSSKYASFAQNLFSAYPNDLTLTQMRRLRRRRSHENRTEPPRAQVDTVGGGDPDEDTTSAQGDRRQELESLLASFEIFDYPDLLAAAPAILALGEENDVDDIIIGLNERELRNLMTSRAQQIFEFKPEALRVAQKMLVALKRVRLRS